MAEFSQKELSAAQSVRDAVSQLNSAIKRATDAQLYLDIDYMLLEEIGKRHPMKLYQVYIERREVVPHQPASVE